MSASDQDSIDTPGAPRVGRTWELWAYRYEGGALWHIGDLGWVKLHQLPDPLVPVLVKEILGDPYAPEVTHYGWQDRQDPEDVPTMIQIRAGADPKRALGLLSICFAYGLDAAIKNGDGRLVALRITERTEAPQAPVVRPEP